MTFADKVLRFYKSLRIQHPLPEGVIVLNPYREPDIFPLIESFYKKYYDDNRIRRMIIGINPGRFGAGLTGIPFTDPVKLEKLCGIQNNLPKKTELSADFIHSVIAAAGGHPSFYNKFFINSVSPLGFTLQGKNLNYYDSGELEHALRDFIIESMNEQLAFGVDRAKAFCLGEGENFRYLSRLNDDHQFFEQIVPLAHPRFIMQYRRKQLAAFVQDYLSILET